MHSPRELSANVELTLAYTDRLHVALNLNDFDAGMPISRSDLRFHRRELYSSVPGRRGRDHVNGRTVDNISVKTLDLNSSFHEIATQLGEIVDNHFGNISYE